METKGDPSEQSLKHPHTRRASCAGLDHSPEGFFSSIITVVVLFKRPSNNSKMNSRYPPFRKSKENPLTKIWSSKVGKMHMRTHRHAHSCECIHEIRTHLQKHTHTHSTSARPSKYSKRSSTDQFQYAWRTVLISNVSFPNCFET